jgi:hypoxanthine phosphoribosyltransferase
MGRQPKNGTATAPEGNILVPAEEIKSLVHRLAKEIEQSYQGRNLILLGVLKGSFIFMSDLVREIRLPLTCDFIRVSSYLSDGSAGTLRLEFDVTQPVKDKDVLVLEDVVDTGRTLGFIHDHLAAQGAKTTRFAALVQKEHSLGGVQVDYVGKVIPNDYVVGYGMDLNGLYRNLPWIQTISLTKS